MAKQMMQDILINKGVVDGTKEPPKEMTQKKTSGTAEQGTIEDSLPKTPPKEKASTTGNFPSLETSPIFEKLKQHNKDRESFTDEFMADSKSNIRRRLGKIAFVVFILLFAGSFFYGVFFHSALLTVTPKYADVVLQNQEFTTGDPQTNEEGVLPFQLMTISGENSTNLVATGEKNISSKSSGKIVIYNNYGTQSQTLIKNTRFQSPDGKIYRIHDSIVVPGQKTVNGTQTPGSLEVDVYADSAGTEYNLGLVDFTIPGFKGSPRYEKIYARSKTSMTGGFLGVTKVASPTDIQKAKETLTAEMKEKLFTEALAQRPKDTVLYKEAVFYSFKDSTDNAVDTTQNSDTSVKLTMRGSLTTLLFSEETLSRFIAKTSASASDISPNDHLSIENIKELSFGLKDPIIIDPKDGDRYVFTLTGTAHVIWNIDTLALREKLVGVKKADYKNVFAEFPGIEKANAVIRPFWKTKFPDDSAKIQVEIAQK